MEVYNWSELVLFESWESFYFKLEDFKIFGGFKVAELDSLIGDDSSLKEILDKFRPLSVFTGWLIFAVTSSSSLKLNGGKNDAEAVVTSVLLSCEPGPITFAILTNFFSRQGSNYNLTWL